MALQHKHMLSHCLFALVANAGSASQRACMIETSIDWFPDSYPPQYEQAVCSRMTMDAALKQASIAQEDCGGPYLLQLLLQAIDVLLHASLLCSSLFCKFCPGFSQLLLCLCMGLPLSLHRCEAASAGSPEHRVTCHLLSGMANACAFPSHSNHSNDAGLLQRPLHCDTSFGGECAGC